MRTEKQREYSRNYYNLHKKEIDDYFRAYQQKRYLENRAKYWELKRGPCVDCGGAFHPVSMDFDHIGKKHKSIALMLQGGKWEDIITEISRCELVCSNCHRVRTFKRLGNIV